MEDNFRQFASNLEISKTEQNKAAKLQNEIREILENRDIIIKTALSGSYDRQTKIRPLHDIDMLVILHPDSFYDKSIQQRPSVAINEIIHSIQDLKKHFGSIKLKRQNRSINIIIQDIGFDLVPAYEAKGGGFLILDKKLGQWIKTDPIRYAELLSSFNQSSDFNQRLIPFIKMIKSWANNKVPYLKSYLTEILVLKALSYIKFYTQASFQFFAYATGIVTNSVIDPVTGLDLNELLLQERVALSEQFSRFAQLAAKAIIFEGKGEIITAGRHWKIIFGKEFPLIEINSKG